MNETNEQIKAWLVADITESQQLIDAIIADINDTESKMSWGDEQMALNELEFQRAGMASAMTQLNEMS